MSNERKIETLKKVRTHLEGAWWHCEDDDISEALDRLIDMIDTRIDEEKQK